MSLMDIDLVPTQTPVVELWLQLTQSLSSIYDAHHVCATSAQHIANYSQTSVLVVLRALDDSYYDVWLCEPHEPAFQARWSDESELTDILTNKTVYQLDKSDQTQSTLTSSKLWDMVDQCAMIAPFSAEFDNNFLPGGLCLIDNKQLNPETATLESLAKLVSTYLERALLHYTVAQQGIVFEVVNEISIALTSTLSLEDIFDKVANPVRHILNVESVSIGLVEPDSGDLVFVPALLGPMFEGQPELRVRPGQGIAGWTYENNAHLIVNDVYADERFYSDPDESTGFTTSSILCVPLQVEGKVIGVLEAINKKLGRFDNTDLHLMRAIANPLAIALENAQLHDDVVAEKRRIETIFGNMSEGMLTVDASGKITDYNDSMQSLLKCGKQTLIGQTAGEIIQAKGHDFSKFIASVTAARGEAKHLACDVYLKYPSDAVPVLVSASSIISEQTGRPSEAIYVFSDLRQIREVERMRDDFFHNIIHELRTPLATILMYARLLRKNKDGNAGSEKELRFLDVIERESDRLQAMVRQMLALAKLEAREMQRSNGPVQLNPLFDEILPPLADSARAKGLQFEQKVAADLPTITGEQEILYSIFKNLVENALKFTLDGTVSVEAWVEENVVFVEIADEGIGIPDEARPNMFKRFYRTNTAVEHGIAGTGLGLYMVKEGVESHGGTINFISTVGEGTKFIVRLPIAN